MCNTKEELEKLIRKQRKASALKKKLDAKVKSLNAEIADYVLKKGEPGGSKGASFIVYGDDYKVSVIMITQNLWDGDKLKALLGDTVGEYQNPNTYPKVDIR